MPFFSAGTYMVVAPKVVRPGLPYAVSVNILKSQESDHIVRVEIRTSQNETVGAKVVNNIKTGKILLIYPSPNLLVHHIPKNGFFVSYNKNETCWMKSNQ